MAIRQIYHFHSPRTKPQRHAVCKTWQLQAGSYSKLSNWQYNPSRKSASLKQAGTRDSRYVALRLILECNQKFGPRTVLNKHSDKSAILRELFPGDLRLRSYAYSRTPARGAPQRVFLQSNLDAMVYGRSLQNYWVL